MGKDIKITYKILSPLPFTADSAILDVRDKFGVVVYTDNTIPRSGGTHTVTWLVSTASLRSVNSRNGPYEVKITITKGTESADDAKALNVEPSTVTVEAEKSATTGNPITECMEGRKVTFTATARGFVSENRTGHKIRYTFHYVKADGTAWTYSDWSLKLTFRHTATAARVPDGNADHFFITPIYADAADTYTHTAISEKIDLKVYELWINDFKDAGTGSHWMVCVGSNIAYSATSSVDCASWQWQMPDGWPRDVWHPNGGNARQGTGMRIPYTDLSRARNSWFGETYGTVRVSCRDEEGNRFSFDSTSMIPAKKAKVFFSRDVNVDGTAPTAAKPPCWFVFWASNMGGPCSWMYNRTSRHAGGRITWAFDPSMRGAATAPSRDRSRFTVTLGGAGEVLDASDTFRSPRYPVAPGSTFANSAGVQTFFQPGTITLNFTRQPWEAIDSAEFVVKHELRHVEHFRNWVRRGIWYGQRNTDEGVELFPDTYEDGFGTRWDDATTYLHTVPAFTLSDGYDDEIDCEVSAGNPNMPAVSDWAFPGKQWH
jgi:hypothetical protein